MKSLSKIFSLISILALLLVFVLSSCAKTELDSFDVVKSLDQEKKITRNDDFGHDDGSNDDNDDLVTDDEDDDEEEEDDKR